MSIHPAEPIEVEHVEPLVGEALTAQECSRLLRLPLDRTEAVLDRTIVRRVVGFDRTEVERLAERMRAQPDLRRVLLR